MIAGGKSLLVEVFVIGLLIGVSLGLGQTPQSLLEGSYAYEQDGVTFVHIEGSPFQRGYQNGYLAHESLNAVLNLYSTVWGSEYWETERGIAQEFIWDKIPVEYQAEIEGIVAGIQARGYSWDKWDIVALNGWADQDEVYGDLYERSLREAGKEGSCSAFIATGDATTDGQIVIGHNTWWDYWDAQHWCVIFDVVPEEGYRFRYEGSGGTIWSGLDWYLNETGLMVTETSITGQEARNPEGTPVFVRIRTAVQYADSIDKFISIMTTDNNGAYPNEWLVGDAKTGEITSLQLGTTVWDINRTFNGFFGSSNYTWGSKLREALGARAPEPDPTSSSYARYIRWGQLKDEYYGKIDVEVGKMMLSDHYDTLLGRNVPSSRTICGHGEDETINTSWWGYVDFGGAYDGKVTSSNLALDGRGMWVRLGHPCGMPIDVDRFLEEHPGWAEEHPVELQYVRAFKQPNPWTFLGRER